ncbi:MAG: Si-specific NAD(P)(+) transhydrogenase [Oligoflexia bacterium]|nr:Si-specific NAD(P)(+) transhydrogenase [Oligoflexia bacterium]
MKTFDLVVIGSGPGGFKAAIQASKLGKKVAIIEKNKIGGSCTFAGTIPSKSLREAAINKSYKSFKTAWARMQQIVVSEAKTIKHQIERNQIEIIQGTAQIETAQLVQVVSKNKIEKISAKKIIIATGTRPIHHDEFSITKKGIYCSDSILKIKSLPKKMLIIGSGVIGCEYATIFNRLGSKVTLIDRRRDLLRNLDHEIRGLLENSFKENNIDLHLGCKIDLLPGAKGSANLIIKLNGKKFVFDTVLVSMGRKPNTEELGLDSLGVDRDERGFIKVGADYQTNIKGVYAVGDVIGAPSLAAASFEQGRIAAYTAFSGTSSVLEPKIPTGIYTIPEISTFGFNEQEIKERSGKYVIGRSKFSELAKGLISGNTFGLLKLIVSSENRKILGVHLIGNGATELVHIGQILSTAGITIDTLVDTVFNYPTFAEAYKVAALDAVNQLRKV